MATIALSALRTLARQEADMPARSDGGGFVTDTELSGYINSALADLHQEVVLVYEDHFRTEATVTIAAGASTGTLPADFFKLRGVDYIDGSDYVPLEPLNFAERGRYTSSSLVSDRMARRYEVKGAVLVVYPSALAPGSYRVHYITRFTDLAVDATEISDILFTNRWYMYAVHRAAIKMLRKEESDISAPVMECERILKQIRDSAQNRDAGGPRRIADVRGSRDVRWRTR